MGKFKITNHRGFHLTFENGVTLSTQFGVGNYCEHHPDPRYDPPSTMDFREPRDKDTWESEDVEIAIWTEEEWITHEMFEALFPEEQYENSDMKEQVKGWVEMEDWLKILDWCREYTT